MIKISLLEIVVVGTYNFHRKKIDIESSTQFFVNSPFNGGRGRAAGLTLIQGREGSILDQMCDNQGI